MTELNELLDSAKAEMAVQPTSSTGGTTTSAVATQARPKFNYSHAAMIDLILAHPGMSQNEIASRIGYSASWVSTVMSSDAFQAKLAEREAEIVDPALRLSVKERFEGMMRRSQEILLEKLNAPASAVSDQLALRAFELSSRAAGYGARAETAPAATTTEVHNHFNLLGDNLVKLLRAKRQEALTIIQEPIDAQSQNA